MESADVRIQWNTETALVLYKKGEIIIIIIIIIVIIIIFINCCWVVTRWQWLFYMYTKHEIGYY